MKTNRRSATGIELLRRSGISLTVLGSALSWSGTALSQAAAAEPEQETPKPEAQSAASQDQGGEELDSLDELLMSEPTAPADTGSSSAPQSQGAAPGSAAKPATNDEAQPATESKTGAEELDVIPVASGSEEATQPTPAATKPKSRVAIEEIVVTAQKREENIQDVPISIQAFSADELDAKGITNPAKLTLVTPGLVYDSFAGFAIIYIRGVGTDAFIPSADLSVATYVDGVYFPFSFQLARAFGNVERIEVLKGPQGTLFGRNSTGGAISIVTKNPGDTFEGSVGLSYGRFNDLQTRAFVSSPLTDTLSASLGVLYSQKDDYYKTTPESGVDELPMQKDKGANLKLRWAPSDAFDAVLNGFLYAGEGTGSLVMHNVAPSPVVGGALGLPASPNDYVSDNNIATPGFNEMHASSLTLNWRTSLVDIKSISAFQEFSANSNFDFDGTSKDVVSFGSRYGKNSPYGEAQLGEMVTQELQFLSNEDSWGAGWLQYVGGLYYFHSDAGFDPVEFHAAGLEDPLSGNPLSLLPPALAQSPLVTTLTDASSGLPASGLGREFLLFGLLETDAYAGFLQATATLSERWSLTLGGRYQDEKRRVYKSRVEAVSNPPDGPRQTLNQYPDDHLHENNFSPKVVLDFRPAEGILSYLSYSKGFKSGSFNIINLTSPPKEIRSEEVTSYELGLKSDLFDNRLRLNAAIFRNEIKDLQVQFLSLFSGGVVQFENAPKAHIDGAEVGGSFAVTDNLVLGFAGTYLTGVYDEFSQGSGFNEETGLLEANQDFSGNTIARTPKLTWSLDLNYFIELPKGSMELGANYYHNDGYFFSAQNTEVARQPEYSLLGAQVSYLFPDTDLRITAFGENLTNERFYLSRITNDFGTLSKLAPPATYGVRLNWNF